MLQCHALTKRFGPRYAVQDVSFCIQSGQIVGLLGPNGAGKTTTLRMLAGSTLPTWGEIEVAGLKMAQHPELAKASIGYLPERPPLYPDLSVREYLDFIAALKGTRKKDKAQMVEATLAQTSLEPVARRLIRNLSRGYQQRVALAQAYLGTPPVLLLDEPTAGLDPRQVADMRELISNLVGKCTVLLSTHALAEVSALCERVIVLNRGRVVTDTSIQGLRQNTPKNNTLEKTFLALTES